MKNFLIISIALIVVIGASIFIVIRNADQKKPDIEELYPKPDIKEMDLTKPDEFMLFTAIFETYEKHFFELYHDGKLLYKGKYEMNLIKYGAGWMFIANLSKKDSTKFRLKALGVDTVFYAPTMNIERLKIVLTDDKKLFIYNDKDINSWLID